MKIIIHIIKNYDKYFLIKNDFISIYIRLNKKAMDIIINLSNQFRDLVIHTIKEVKYTRYNALKINYIDDLSTINILNSNEIFIKNNYIILNNMVIKQLFPSNNNFILKNNEYSIINIQYKNIKWREKDNVNMCYLEKKIREQNIEIINKLEHIKNLNTDFIIILGRKYLDKCKNNKINNCFGILCVDKIIKKYEIDEYKTHIEEDKSIVKNEDKSIIKDDMEIDTNIEIGVSNIEIDSENLELDRDSESVNMIKSGAYRTKFLKTLKNYIYGDQKRNFYIKNEIKRSIFLDVEFINDIYDDFTTFPNSKDMSILFMIGIYYYENDMDKFIYKNLVTKKLDEENEYEILNEYLNVIEQILNRKGNEMVNIFHWSNADLWVITKSINRYPDLVDKNNNLKKVYIDLLKIIKGIVKFESYSLKIVSKKLLDKLYHTECQSGLDAMMNMICNSENLDNNSLHDLIEYNRLDTTIMYDIVNEFCKMI